MGLPLVQVFLIFARQLAKPVSDRIMAYGKSHDRFRNAVLIPIGRGIVNLTTRVRMKNLGLGAPRTLATVSEENALEQASEFLQQLVIFGYSLSVFSIYYTYLKTEEKSLVTKEEIDDLRAELRAMNSRFTELDLKVDFLSMNKPKSGWWWWSHSKPAIEPASSSRNPTDTLHQSSKKPLSEGVIVTISRSEAMDKLQSNPNNIR